MKNEKDHTLIELGNGLLLTKNDSEVMLHFRTKDGGSGIALTCGQSSHKLKWAEELISDSEK